jgi:hypothetical protein
MGQGRVAWVLEADIRKADDESAAQDRTAHDPYITLFLVSFVSGGYFSWSGSLLFHFCVLCDHTIAGKRTHAFRADHPSTPVYVTPLRNETPEAPSFGTSVISHNCIFPAGTELPGSSTMLDENLPCKKAPLLSSFPTDHI